MTRLSPDRLALLRAVLAGKGLAAPRAAGIPRRTDASRAPLSWAQERLYFLELYEPGTALHNDAVAVRIEGALEPDALRRALGAIQRRHEILRTSFALGREGAEQRVHELDDPPLRVVDASAAPDPLARARALATEDARAPFELERAPLWRATLARLAERDWLFVLTMHHSVSDGTSMGLFFDELSALYATGPLAGAPAPVPLAVQFGDYAAWERGTRDERGEQEHLAFWGRTLGRGLARHTWPDARGRATGRGAIVPFSVSPEGLRGIARLGQDERATSNQVLLSAWFCHLSALTGETDLRTGIACSLRSRPELDPLIGFFVQSLVVRVDLSGDPTFPEVVRRVRAAALEALEHADLPFDRVVRAVQPAGSGVPLLQTYFSHMKDAIRPPSPGGARATWEFVDPGVARFELSLVLHESAQEIRGFLEHDLGLFAPASARELAEGYVRRLEVLLARPGLRLSELGAPGAAPGPAEDRASLPLPFPRPRAGQA